MKLFFKVVLYTSISLFSLYSIQVHSTSQKIEETIDLSHLVESIDDVMHQNHYNIEELKGEGYQSVLKQMNRLATEVDSKQEFLKGFKKIWSKGPFSHVVIGAHNGNAEQVAKYLDSLNAGKDATDLIWKEDIAILTVNTMMGQDTIKAIEAHYQTIYKNNASALIIDLRNNEGGAFAIRPLISHLINKPLNAGYFIAQNWSSKNNRLPTKNELNKLIPWSGWSIMAFWNDVQNDSLVKVQIEPATINLDIPVFILTSYKTASASELATEALQSAGRVTVVGEKTAGQMLSQKPFDLPYDLQLYVPIADYYSIKTGRLEGNPIKPNVVTSADKALEVALNIAAKS